MNESVVIYGVPDDANNERVRVKLGTLRGVNVRIVVCPPSVRELYRVPFMEDGTGARHFGMAGIERFVSRRLAAQSSL